MNDRPLSSSGRFHFEVDASVAEQVH